jgi:mannose-1-phosphate guanylyltransferase/phosphomannomutase
VKAIGADLGAAFDRPGERLHLIDDRGEAIPPEKALLLYLRLLGGRERSGRVVFPVTATSQVDRLAEEAGFEVVRTRASLAGLTQAATAEGVVFAGSTGGGYVFPRFLPAYDAVASLAHLLELLAPVERPLSELVAELPEPTLVRCDVACPWALKGTVMRVLNERFADRDVDVTDGIKVFEERGWGGVLPDPDEPVIHVYAEGETRESSEELAAELSDLVEEIQQGSAAPART